MRSRGQSLAREKILTSSAVHNHRNACDFLTCEEFYGKHKVLYLTPLKIHTHKKKTLITLKLQKSFRNNKVKLGFLIKFK